MKRKASNTTQNQQAMKQTPNETPNGAPYQQASTCIYMLIIPKEVVEIIALYTDIISQRALVCTCTLLNRHHKLLKEKQTCTWLSNVNYDDKRKCIKQTEHFMSQTGWRTVETKLEIAPISPENSYAHHVRALELSDTVEIPKGINPEWLTALVMKFNYGGKYQLNILEEFPNLMLLSLSNVTFENDDNMTKGFGLHLKAISLNNCKCTNNQMLRILEDCTNLQEIELSYCKFGDRLPKFPPPLEKLELTGCSAVSEKQIDISLCTELKHLIIQSAFGAYIIISHPSTRLDTAEFDCHLENPDDLVDFLSDLKILAIGLLSINDYGKLVPSLTDDKDTYHLGISLFENLEELHIHNCRYLGHTLICKLPQRIGSIIIKLFSQWERILLAEFEFELSSEESLEVSIDLSIIEDGSKTPSYANW